MFNWLLRRRPHKVALPAGEVRKVTEGVDKIIHALRLSEGALNMIMGVNRLASDLGYNAPIIRHLDNVDHITCIKCGHTHIVRRE